MDNFEQNNCCVCLSEDCSAKISENDAYTVPIITKLQNVVPEVEWKPHFKICLQCLNNLNNVVEFKQLCLETNLTRFDPNVVKTKDELVQIDDFEAESLEDLPNIDQQTTQTLNEVEKVALMKYQCKKCLRTYTLEKTLEKHEPTCDGVRRHNKFNIFPSENRKEQCSKCLKYFSTRKVLGVHLRRWCASSKTNERNKTPKKRQQCKKCRKFYTSSQQSFENHSKLCKGRSLPENKSDKVGLESSENGKQPLNTCILCKLELENSEKIAQHVFKVHKIDITNDLVCKTCYFLADTKESLEKHENLEHASTKTKRSYTKSRNKAENCELSCEVCGDVFNKACKVIGHCVLEHKMNEKDVKPYGCKICKARFPYVTSCMRHMLTHTNARSHVCSFCGKLFLTNTDLNVHELIHLDQRNYRCDVCYKGFNTNTNLRTHKKIVHGDPLSWKYQCEYCNKRFALKSNYDVHIKRHKGVKDFPCTICEKAFICKSDLVKHVGYHTNTRTFRCQFCPKEYRQNSVLAIHLAKIHGMGTAKVPSKERRFACHVCPKTFYDKTKLTRHLCTHTGMKPFDCPMCEKQFTDKSYLKQHMKLAHQFENDAPTEYASRTSKLLVDFAEIPSKTEDILNL